jgi:GWxTD domain-containing protein
MLIARICEGCETLPKRKPRVEQVREPLEINPIRRKFAVASNVCRHENEVGMKKTSAAIIVLFTSTTISAQISDGFSTYFDGPEGFLITKKERKVWKKITSDAEAEEFIALFWARRDPDLNTAVNEFRLDFDQRVEAADQLFGYDSTRGALSDRARVLILLGSCSRRMNRPPGALASGVQDPNTATGGPSRLVASGSLYQNRGSTDFWEYRSEDLPFRFGQVYVNAVFLETDVGDNDYVLDRGNASLMHVLSKMPEALIKNPNLTEVPGIGLIPGSRLATADEKACFDTDPRPWPDSAVAFATAGLAPGPQHFLWVHLSLEEEISNAASVVGRVRAAGSSEEFGSFVVPVEDAAIGGGAIELSIPVGEGRWSMDVALSGDTGLLAVKTVDVETAKLQTGVTSVSPFVWGTNVQQKPNSRFGDPFSIGGWRVAPVLDSTFSTSSAETLNYMAYVFEPELDPDGNPQFTVRISLYKDGEQVARSPSQPAPLSRLTDGVWMFGRGLPLERFSQPGSYMLEVEIEQTTDGTKGTIEIPFEMVEKESGAENS